MTKFLAAPQSPARLSLARSLSVKVALRPSNDNARGIASDTLLHEALRHFARYGLGAAEQARENAENAFFAGDRQQYDWWIEICRTLDRRMAAAVAARKDAVPQG